MNKMFHALSLATITSRNTDYDNNRKVTLNRQ